MKEVIFIADNNKSEDNNKAEDSEIIKTIKEIDSYLIPIINDTVIIDGNFYKIFKRVFDYEKEHVLIYMFNYNLYSV